MLALAGHDNIIFFPVDGGWTYLLIDPLPSVAIPILAWLPRLVRKVASRIPLSKIEHDVLKRAINFVRTVNGVALSIGSDISVSRYIGMPVRAELSALISDACLLR